MKYLYFSASWCGPCRTLGPIMNEVSQQIPVQKVDVDSEFELASQYNVRNVPTVVLLDNGQEVKRFVGVQPKETYLNAVK
jgi:thioredoxin 1